ncbi:MAG: carboxypeptidase regulatory-like domain-containing protein [Deltaproteobacteria bacterium]|nr:carboxypeptidase regulatory-like domain-containing protein [Deltaproteobacteria bacterium]
MQRLFRTSLLLLPLVLAQCTCDGLEPIGELPGTILGQVCDVRTGAGSAGVEMAITLLNGSSKRVESQGGGMAKMENVEPGVYDVVFSQSLPGGRADVRSVPRVEVKSNLEVQVTDPACIAGRNPPGTGWVRGKICNRHTGDWVGAADVTIQLSSGEIMATATDLEGNFLLEGVPAGDHVLYVRSQTFQRAYAITVVAGRETTLESSPTCTGLDPNSGGVEGVFCSPAGTGPLTGALAYVDVGNPATRLSDLTDADGHFIITGIPAGNYDLHVEQGAYNRTYPITITVGIIAVIGPSICETPNLNTTGRIDGLFCNPGSVGPLVGASVTVDLGSSVLEDVTDSLGRFEFAGVPPGNYEVQVHSVSLNQSYPVTVVAGQTTHVQPQGECTSIGGPVGEIQGRICAPNGTTWLANARVWVDTSNGTIETQTDSNGRFTLLNVPPGTYVVHVAAGTFTTDYPNVEVRANEITTIGASPDQCVPLEDTHKIAVVTGQFDEVQVVLNRLGLNNIDLYDGINGTFASTLLGDYALMQTYDVIFFNCGLDDTYLHTEGNNQVAVQNLRAYVDSGKSTYFSDWAYNLVETAWPNFVDFYGDDSALDSAKVAKDVAALVGNVVDPGLRNALGQQTVSINYNLIQWVPASGAGSATRVYLRGNPEVCMDFFCDQTSVLNNVPLTVGFHPSSAAGKVIFTSFHQERQTTQDMDQILQMLVFEL